PEINSGSDKFNLLRKGVNDLLSTSATKGLFPTGLSPSSAGDLPLKYLYFDGQIPCQARVGN
ncbi:MAG TPA: hypothetical protein VEK32_18775, partial [Thermodesulfobacteriota bacterium]|nr:hypothetical protein [Thermodesulfobacteriota bacterium]